MSQTKAQLIDPVDGTIVDADINASAAIAGTKISPSFTSDITVTNTAPTISFVDSNADSDFRIRINDGTFKIQDITNSGNARLVIDSNGKVGIGVTSPTGLLSLQSNNPNIQFNDNDTSNNAEITLDNTSLRIESDESNAVDNSTIIFRIDADEKAKIDSSGNLGIGVTSTGARLHVHEGSSSACKIRVTNTTTGTATSDGFEFGIGSGEEAFFNMKENAPMKFNTNSIERMRLDSSGRLLIKNSSSTNGRLVVEDTSNQISIETGTSGDGRLHIGHFNNGAFIGTYGDDGGAADFIRFGTHSGDERMRIQSDGKVGIGTNAPGALLHVSALGASDEPTFKVSSENSTIFLRTAGSSGSFPTGGGGDDGELLYLGGDFRLGVGTASKNLIFFNGSGYTERMRIDSSGNIGIGTTNPQRLLHQHVASSAANYHSFTNTTTGSSSTDGLLLGINSSEEAIIWNYENTAMEFATNGTERMRISSSGNVGIGDSNPDQKLVVSGTGTTILKVENTDDGTAQITLGNVGSSNLGIKQNSGETAFEIGGTEKMRIRGDGLCIGTTTHSSSGNRLTIQSTSAENLAHFNKNGTGNKSILSLQHGRATGSTVGNGIIFRNSGGTNVGEIEITNSEARTVGFSDYRMKENIADITNGINSVKNLAPKTFNYIHDETKKVLTGFIAHEIQSVLPQAVTGDKDAVVTQALIDSDDVLEGEVGDPIYQKVCITDLIPTLTAALKEAITKIETLETKVAALEAA
tara:strand:- start:101 stop:2353 length:2253 start_codon:yes stop_codon:yes gene_type:complete